MASSTDEAEDNVGIHRQAPNGTQKGIERIARTVISRIHDNELTYQPVLATKFVPTSRVEMNIVMRPRSDHR